MATVVLDEEGPAVEACRAPCVEPEIRNAVTDKMLPIPYHRQHLEGLLGNRIDINTAKTLLRYPVEEYLRTYRTDRLARWPTGEYLGKYVQAGVLAYQYSGSADLLEQLSELGETWIETLPDDGYHVVRGPHEEYDRWAGAWEVWELKYVLVGLLSLYLMSGDERLLNTARRIGDLLCTTFGYGEGQLDLMGVGALRLGTTSVLEPMVDLYRHTGQKRYLDFCNYIMQAHEQEPNGTKIISELLQGSGEVDQVGGPGQHQKGKAYEMLSSFVGILRMYQLTGRQQYLDAMLVAWEDIRENRLFVTGTTANHEYFLHKHVLPGESHNAVGEGCVTSHWLFFNRVLFYITGEPKFIDEIELTLYNALLASQDPHLGLQSYFTPLNGARSYQMYGVNTGSPPCCSSSVAREIVRTPGAVWAKPSDGGVALLLYTTGTFRDSVEAVDRVEVELELKVQTDFPKSGTVTVILNPEGSAKLSLLLRVPGWCTSYEAKVNGDVFHGIPGSFLDITRTWQAGDRVEIVMDLPVGLVGGAHTYPGHFAVKRGPQVLAVDGHLSDGAIDRATIDPTLGLDLEDASDRRPKGWFGDQVYTTPSIRLGCGEPAVLAPFADAGQFGWIYEDRKYGSHDYRVWIRDAGAPATKWTRVQDTDPTWVIEGKHTREADERLSDRTRTRVEEGGTMQITFQGLQVRVVGAPQDSYADIVVDGDKYRDIKWYGMSPRRPFTSRRLDPGTHALKIIAREGPITLDYIEVCTLEP